MESLLQSAPNIASSDQPILQILSLYRLTTNALPRLDPASPLHDEEEKTADQLMAFACSLAEQAVSMRSTTAQEIMAKLQLAVLESETGDASSPDADRTTRLAASAAADLADMFDAADIPMT